MAKLVYHDPNIRITRPKSLIVHLPEEMRPFQYPKARGRRPEPQKLQQPAPPTGETLTGFVHGHDASALEERFAAALDFYNIPYIFQFAVYSAYSIPGEERVIDFVVQDAGLQIPVEPGAVFLHASPAQRAIDEQRQAILNPILMAMGIQPLGDSLYEIPPDRPTSIEDAKALVAELFVSA